MVAAVQSLAFYCFPLLTGLLLHVMRQRDHDSYQLRRQHERGETARSLHDTIGNDLAYLILRIDHAETVVERIVSEFAGGGSGRKYPCCNRNPNGRSPAARGSWRRCRSARRRYRPHAVQRRRRPARSSGCGGAAVRYKKGCAATDSRGRRPAPEADCPMPAKPSVCRPYGRRTRRKRRRR